MSGMTYVLRKMMRYYFHIEKGNTIKGWGCSSVGRAGAYHAQGSGIDPQHWRKTKTNQTKNKYCRKSVLSTQKKKISKIQSG